MSSPRSSTTITWRPSETRLTILSKKEISWSWNKDWGPKRLSVRRPKKSQTWRRRYLSSSQAYISRRVVVGNWVLECRLLGPLSTRVNSSTRTSYSWLTGTSRRSSRCKTEMIDLRTSCWSSNKWRRSTRIPLTNSRRNTSRMFRTYKSRWMLTRSSWLDRRSVVINKKSTSGPWECKKKRGGRSSRRNSIRKQKRESRRCNSRTQRGWKWWRWKISKRDRREKLYFKSRRSWNGNVSKKSWK